MIPRSLQVQILLNVLLFLGGAGSAVGVWVGQTYIFEPKDEPPIIKSADVYVNTHQTKDSDHVILKAVLDRLGRCQVVVTYLDGTEATLGPSPTVANTFQVVVSKPGYGVWYKLAQGHLPNWIESLKVIALKASRIPDEPGISPKKSMLTIVREK